MEAILLSVQPKWCELIANLQKTMEMRKTAPKETPFKVYLYCTKPKEYFSLGGGMYACSDSLYRVNGKIYCGDGFEHYNNKIQGLNGKVIGEFICNEIEYFNYGIQIPDEATNYLDCYEGYPDWPQLEEQSQVPLDELLRYGNKKGLFGWHISNLVIYDRPKELSEFKRINRNCYYSDLGLAIPDCEQCKDPACMLQKAPQSWCYVEVNKK